MTLPLAGSFFVMPINTHITVPVRSLGCPNGAQEVERRVWEAIASPYPGVVESLVDYPEGVEVWQANPLQPALGLAYSLSYRHQGRHTLRDANPSLRLFSPVGAPN